MANTRNTQPMDTQEKCESIFRCYVKLRKSGYDHDAAIADIMAGIYDTSPRTPDPMSGADLLIPASAIEAAARSLGQEKYEGAESFFTRHAEAALRATFGDLGMRKQLSGEPEIHSKADLDSKYRLVSRWMLAKRGES